MTYATVYDIANDSIGVQFPLIGLSLILIGALMKWGLGKPGLYSYPLIVAGVFTLLAAGALPLWNRNRVMRAAADGEAKQVEGPIRNWRVVHGNGKRYGSSTFHSHYELFSIGNVDFDIEWGLLEAGFTNRGSTEEQPKVRLASGMPARIWYLPIDGPGKPPRITRIDLASVGWADAVRQPDAGTAFKLAQGRVADAAGILSADQKAPLDTRLAAFERTSGHQLVIVTTPSLGGQDIARYATHLANERGIGRRGQDDGILLLVAPNERRARIVVGRGLEDRLPDAVVQEIMGTTILPLFRRGDIPTGIEAGASAIIGKVMSEERR